MKKVQILLSTYNGEKYIEEQMESLLTQTYPNIDILIRDDGSTDYTTNILRTFAKRKNIKIMEQGNIGVIGSFFQLLVDSSPEADYFAFCDQDDYWQKDKVSVAVDMLSKFPDQTPVLYCSRIEVVDEKLQHINWYPLRKRGPSFNNALVQNIATGCTIVMNKAARELLLKRLPATDAVVMHDWWCYLVISAFGHVIYDPESKILYRQHASNTLGAGQQPVGRWLKRIKRYVNRGEYQFVTKQNTLFWEKYGDRLDVNKKEILERLLTSRKTFFRRLQYAFCNDVFGQSKTESLACRIALLLNLL